MWQVRFNDTAGCRVETKPHRVLFLRSPNGALLSLVAEGDEARTRWLLSLDGGPDEWVEVPTTVANEDPGYILFVPGTGD